MNLEFTCLYGDPKYSGEPITCAEATGLRERSRELSFRTYVLLYLEQLYKYSNRNRRSWNPQALFCFQGTMALFLHRSQKVETNALPAGSAPDIPVAEARGLTARSNKDGDVDLHVFDLIIPGSKAFLALIHLESDIAVRSSCLSTAKSLLCCPQPFAVWQCHQVISKSSHVNCQKASLPEGP